METILDLAGISLPEIGIGKTENRFSELLEQVPVFSQRPVFVDEKQAYRYKAIVRDETGDVISIRGHGYALVQHTDVLNMVFKAMSLTGLGIDRVMPKFVGGKMFGTILFKDRSFVVGKNDKIQTGIHIINSVDGSTGVTICPATFRLICKNQMGHEDFINSVVRWHCGNPMNLMESLKNSIMEAVESIEQIHRFYESWNGEKFSIQSLKNKAYAPMVEILPQKYLNAIVEENPKTKWGLFNVLTELNTHDENRSPNVQENFNSVISKMMEIKVSI